MKRYNPSEIEPKWQANWAEQKTYECAEDASRPKAYATPMLPYPSGAGLHVGHVRNYSIADAVARFERQKGKNSLFAIGWDSFGLPAENYAIKTGTPPWESTSTNIANFKNQLSKLGMSIDWSREINTSDPSYYKWTQWIFTKLHEKGLAYQAESMQWWCNECKTVLANEQVVNGCCWRHEELPVIKKYLKQWFFKITEYADVLLEETDALDWPESIKAMQKNWIGKSKGAEIDFTLENSDEKLRVFTTRPDTLYGATFLVLAPEHPMLEKLVIETQKTEVSDYITKTNEKSNIERMETNREKTGVFTGSYALNPINGAKIPIWVADYVLMGYGTGAIMAVPAHDERDGEFAKKFSLPIIQVIEPEIQKPEDQNNFSERGDAIVAVVINKKDDTVLTINWKPDETDISGKWAGNFLVGGGVEENENFIETAKREIAEETGYKDLKFIGESTYSVLNHYYSVRRNEWRNARLHGVYFELASDKKEEAKPEDYEKDAYTVEWVPLSGANKLIKDEAHNYFLRDALGAGEVFTDEGVLINSGAYDGAKSGEAREKIVTDLVSKNCALETTNYKMRDWLISRQRYWGAPIPIIHCEDHGAVAVPEKDLPVILPEVKNFAPTGEATSVLALEHDWVNAPCPTCGKPGKRETDTMDGYACSSWYILRYCDPKNSEKAWDPEKVNYWMPMDFYFGGDHAVSHLLYFRFWMHFFADQGLIKKEAAEPVKKLVYNGYINGEDGNKMSKSKGNVVDPLEVINEGYGADALRVFELFIGPYDQDASWSTAGLGGAYRFLQRVWTLTQEYLEAKSHDAPSNRAILVSTNKAVKKVSKDLESLSFNTAVAAMMEYVNELYKVKAEDNYSSSDWQLALENLVQLLAPFAPHLAEELWQELGHSDSVHINHWPTWDEEYLIADEITVVVQVNGKLRGELIVSADADEETVKNAAMQNEKISGYITGDPKKIIFVKGRLINFVI